MEDEVADLRDALAASKREATAAIARSAAAEAAAAETAGGEAKTAAALRERLAAAEAEAVGLRAEVNDANARAGGGDDRSARARVAQLENALKDARQETNEARREAEDARRRAAAAAAAAGEVQPATSSSSGGGARELAASEATAQRLRATVEALERDNKSLQWQVAMTQSGGGGATGGVATATGKGFAKGARPGGLLATSTTDGPGALPALKRHKREIFIAYLVLLHVYTLSLVTRAC